jgi:hypothetical protein
MTRAWKVSLDRIVAALFPERSATVPAAFDAYGVSAPLLFFLGPIRAVRKE